MFTRLDEVKSYYQLRLNETPNDELLARYKNRIQDAFFPKRGFGEARLSIAQKPIQEYKKITNSPNALIDLMVFYVELGVKFTIAYGDIDAPFYSSVESMFARAIKLMAKYQLRDQFEMRCRNIVQATSHTGWGFHDNLSATFTEYFTD